MKALNRLKKMKKRTFSTAEARRAGVTPPMLTYLVRRGAIQRRSQGLYAFAEPEDLTETIGEVLALVPQGIVGFAMALQLHGLTDELPDDIELLVPDRNVPKRKLTGVRLHRVRGDMKRIRTTTINGIQVTTVEQTIIDLLRAGSPLSQLIEIFRMAQRRRLAPSLTELTKIAAAFRAKGRTKVLVEALL